MFKTTKGLVLREVRYKEADRILTVLTQDEGKITAKARGALRKSSRTAAATQQLTWAEMTLFGNRGKWTVNEASVLESFQGLREDIAAFALGSYFAECLEAFAVEDQPDPELLQLGLNSLYAVSQRLYPAEKVKAAFELRLAVLTGYSPALDACAFCGKEQPEDPILGLDTGGVCCRACRKAEFGNAARLDAESLEAMRYIVSAPAKRLFSFRLGEESGKLLAMAAEKYLQSQAGRSFGTLAYYKQF